MLEALWDQFEALLGLGLEVGDVDAVQMALRTVLIYVSTLVIIRLGNKRFLAEATAFDVIIGIMLGSVMSRAINGSAPFFPTVAAGFMFVIIHWLLAALSVRLDWLGPFVKGGPTLLIKDGVVQREGMRQSNMSRHDLEQALRQEAGVTDPSKVRRACLERNGKISVLLREEEPRVFTVSVKDGVQTLRIELQ